MNCPECGGYLVSTKREVGKGGLPFFTFSCPSHGKVLSQGMRQMSKRYMYSKDKTVISSIEELIIAYQGMHPGRKLRSSGYAKKLIDYIYREYPPCSSIKCPSGNCATCDAARMRNMGCLVTEDLYINQHAYTSTYNFMGCTL